MSSTADSVRRFLALCLGAAAIAQAVAAILFYFAGNWWGMSPALKIGLIDLLLLLCAGAAVLALPGSVARSAWASAGAVLSGVLFGVHGQIWQSGADAWELFALWTVLAALWAGLARADAAWLIAAVLGMTGLWLWGDHAAPRTLLPSQWEYTVLALPPLLVVVAARFAGGGSAWLLPSLLALAAVALGIGGIDEMRYTLLPLGLGLVAAGATMALARPARCGPWPFAIAVILAVFLVEAAMIEHLVDSAEGLLVVALLLLAGIAAVAKVLRRLFVSQMGVDAHRLELVMSVAIGLGAWIAAGAALTAVGMLVAVSSGERHIGIAVASVGGLAALGIRLLWPGAQTFGTHVQAALAVMAYGALLVELGFQDVDFDIIAIVAVVLLAPLALVTRAASAGAVATTVALSLAAYRLHEFDPLAVAVFSVALVPVGWFGLGRPQPALRAGAVVLLLGAFALPAWLEFFGIAWGMFDRAAAALSAAGVLAATVWTRRDLADPRLLGAGGLVLVASLAVPAGAAGLVGLTAASARAVGRPLVVLGFAAAGWSVVRYYYLLELPLVDKAGLLAVGAVLTGVAWGLLAGRPQMDLRPGAASAVLLAGALVPAAIQAWDGAGKARLAAEGREVLLPLRPSDPRSLIQGDYMTLRYSRDLTESLPESGGPVALRLDGVRAVSARPADGALAADEILLRTRPGRDEPRLAPDSFLFEEGTGDDWARACFAIVRIKDGALVMTGLADAAQQPITPRPKGAER
ncbi:MAG: GDYXXLXY domain-containing protein [Bacteroidota bacterium]